MDKEDWELIYLDWLFIFVLPVALLKEPCSKYADISCNVLTAISVIPASVIIPFAVSRICIGDFPGTVIFPEWPLELEVSDLPKDTASNRSLTSSFKIFKIKCIIKSPTRIRAHGNISYFYEEQCTSTVSQWYFWINASKKTAVWKIISHGTSSIWQVI